MVMRPTRVLDVVFGLGEQVSGDEVGFAGSLSATMKISDGAGKLVDADGAKHLAFGLRLRKALPGPMILLTRGTVSVP